MSTVFYLASVVLSLYAAYLFTFRTYDCDYEGKQGERLTCPNIVYVFVWLMTLVPIGNVVLCLVFAVVALVNMACNDVYVDSWLFRKPNENNESER